MKKWQFLIYIVPFLTLLLGCTKVLDESEIKLDSISKNISVYDGDKLMLYYSVISSHADSVSLYVNSDLYATQKVSEKQFLFDPWWVSSFELHLILHHHSGLTKQSNSIQVNVDQNDINRPEFSCNINKYDGDTTYYVGDKLLLSLVLESSWFSTDDIKQVSFSNYGIDLGSVNTPPFIMETPVILMPMIAIEIDILAKNNIVYNFVGTYDIPRNSSY